MNPNFQEKLSLLNKLLSMIDIHENSGIHNRRVIDSKLDITLGWRSGGFRLGLSHSYGGRIKEDEQKTFTRLSSGESVRLSPWSVRCLI